MQLSIQIYNALGEAVTDAELRWVDAGTKVKQAVPFDPRQEAYPLVYNPEVGGELVITHAAYIIDGLAITPDAPQAGLCILSAGGKGDDFTIFRGQRVFRRVLMDRCGVVHAPIAWQSEEGMLALSQLESTLDLQRVPVHRPSAAEGAHERKTVQTYDYVLGRRSPSLVDVLRHLRESGLCTAVGMRLADGSIVAPLLHVETDEAGLAWLQSQGLEPELERYGGKLHAVVIPPQIEADIDRFLKKLYKTGLFEGFWQALFS